MGTREMGGGEGWKEDETVGRRVVASKDRGNQHRLDGWTRALKLRSGGGEEAGGGSAMLSRGYI